MTTFTEATLLAFIAAHHCVPAKVADIMVAYAAIESGYDTTKVNEHNPNGSKDVGIVQVNSRNFDWLSEALGQPVNEQTLLANPCLNLAAGLRVLLVRFNGDPKDPIKIRYTNKLLDKLADSWAPAPVTVKEVPLDNGHVATCNAPAWDMWARRACEKTNKEQ